MKTTGLEFKIKEMAQRISDLREIMGLSTAEMALKTGVSEEEYLASEKGAFFTGVNFLMDGGRTLMINKE